MIKVLLADDHHLVRTGFRVILETEDDIEVVGEAADGAQAIELARTAAPDVVLMDVEMPGMDGLTATRELTRAAPGDGPGPAVLILTTFDRDDYLFAALQAGASGFLLKNGTPETLIDAVRVVARGDALLAPEITRRVIAAFARPGADQRPGAELRGGADQRPGAELRAGGEFRAGAGAAARRLAGLTPREREVLELLAAGASNAEIAAHLYLGEATVKTHVSRVLAKLELRDRVQAVVFAYEHGVVQPGG